MNTTEPTADELTNAYKRARLRQAGISYQKAITTSCIRIALRCTAIALRSKQPAQTDCAHPGEKP